jgi:hypothetical protein
MEEVWMARNITFQDIDPTVSEKSVKLKRAIYGKKYGNYMNKPLCDLDNECQPFYYAKSKMHPSRGAFKKPRTNKMRKTFSHNAFNIPENLSNFYEEQRFRDSMYADKRTHRVPKRRKGNPFYEKLIKDRKNILKDPQLFEGMMKLKDMDRLKKPRSKIRVSKHWPSKRYQYNDYHTKAAKNGYSRNRYGQFFNS